MLALKSPRLKVPRFSRFDIFRILSIEKLSNFPLTLRGAILPTTRLSVKQFSIFSSFLFFLFYFFFFFSFSFFVAFKPDTAYIPHGSKDIFFSCLWNSRFVICASSLVQYALVTYARCVILADPHKTRTTETCNTCVGFDCVTTC